MRPFLVSGAAYGGLVGNVTDAAQLAAAHVACGPGASVQLGDADLWRMRQISASGKPFDHGIGWFRRPTDAHRSPAFVEHYGYGGGFWNAMRIYPEQQLAMVAMTNTTSAWDVHALYTQLGELSWR
jgi:CubicO group peptidase (beta-lactamase class C family)